MNWKERIKPSNATETGCLIFFVSLAILAFFFFSGLDEYFSYFAAGGWLTFYVFKHGREAMLRYKITPFAAHVTSAAIIMAYTLVWIGLLNLGVKIIQPLIPRQAVVLLVFVVAMFLAYLFYQHLLRFRMTIFEQWLGWQPKEGLADG